MDKDASSCLAAIGLIAVSPLVFLFDGWILGIVWRASVAESLGWPAITTKQAIMLLLLASVVKVMFWFKVSDETDVGKTISSCMTQQIVILLLMATASLAALLA